MMNRNARESLVGGRNFPAGSHQQHRRGGSLNLAVLSSSMKQDPDESSLDLFSKSRRTLSVASSDDSSDGTFQSSRHSFLVLVYICGHNCPLLVLVLLMIRYVGQFGHFGRIPADLSASTHLVQAERIY